jgi:hypothetical protein
MYTGGHRYVEVECRFKCSGQGGGFVSCSPKYIIKKEVECRYLKKALKNPFKALILKRISTTFKALSNAKYKSLSAGALKIQALAANLCCIAIK